MSDNSNSAVAFLDFRRTPELNPQEAIPEGAEVTVRAVFVQPIKDRLYENPKNVLQLSYTGITKNKNNLYFMVKFSVVGGYNGRPYSWTELFGTKQLFRDSGGHKPDTFAEGGRKRLKTMLRVAFGFASEDDERLNVSNSEFFKKLTVEGGIPPFNVVVKHETRGIYTDVRVKEFRPAPAKLPEEAPSPAAAPRQQSASASSAANQVSAVSSVAIAAPKPPPPKQFSVADIVEGQQKALQASPQGKRRREEVVEPAPRCPRPKKTMFEITPAQPHISQLLDSAEEEPMSSPPHVTEDEPWLGL
jgi:hypothetical protein